MSFKLTILGSCSAIPNYKKFQTAHVLNVHERFFLIDCGEAAQIRLSQYKIPISKLNHIFISHLHGDHYFGIFGLLSTMNMLDRKSNLHIYCHQDLEKKINFMFYREEFHFKIIFHYLNYEQPELIFENKIMTVKSFPLKHKIETCGFIFKEKQAQKNIRKEAISKYNLSIAEIVKIKNGSDLIDETGIIISNSELTTEPAKPRSYAFCSDTKYCESMFEEIRNVDLLFHEATFSEKDSNLASKTGHSTTKEAAETAQLVDAKKLLIGHFSIRYLESDILLQEAKKYFENTFSIKDGDVFEVKPQNI